MSNTPRETNFSSALASFVIIGILLIWTGIHGMKNPDSVTSAFDISKGILSIFLIPLSAVSLHRKMPAICILSLTVSLISLTFVINTFSSYGHTTTPFSVILIVLSAVMFLKNKYSVAVATALLASSVLFGTELFVGNILSVASRLAFLVLGTYYYVIIRKNGFTAQKTKQTDISHIPAIALVGMHGIVMCVAPNDEMSVVLCITIVLFSLSAVVNNRILTGTAALMYGICNIIAVIPESVASCVFCIPTIICGTMLIDKNKIAGTVFVVFGITFATSVLLDSEIISEFAFAAAGIGGTVLTMLLLTYGTKIDDVIDNPPILSEIPSTLTVGSFSVSCMAIILSVLGKTAFSDGDTYADIIVLISSALVVFMAIVALRGRMITESITMILSGISVMILAVADITYETDGLALMSAFVSAGLAICSYIFIRRGHPMRGTAAFFIMLATISISAGFYSVSFVSYLVSGILFMISASKKTYVFCISKNGKITARDNLGQTDSEYSALVVKTIGIFLIALLTLMYGINTIGREQYEGMELVRVILCLVLMGFGTYAVYNGIGQTGIFMFMTSVFGMTSSLTGLMNIQIPGTFQQLVSLAFVSVFIVSFRNRDLILFLISFLMFLAFIINPVSGMDAIFTVSDMLLKIITCTSAVLLWIRYDTGHNFMETLYNRLNGKRKQPKVSREPLRTTCFMGIMVTSLACIWSGYVTVSGNQSDFGYVIPLIVISSAGLLFSICMICKGLLTESLCTLAICITNPILMFDIALNLPAATILISIVILAVIEKRHDIAVVSGTYTASIVLFMSSFQYAGGTLMVALGIISLIGSTIILSGFGKTPVSNGRLCDYALVIASSLGMISTTMPTSVYFSVSGLIVSCVAGGLALAIMMKGEEIKSLYILSTAIPCIGYCILNIAGIISESDPLVIMSLSMTVAGIAFIIRKNITLSASCVVVVFLSVAFLMTNLKELLFAEGIAYSILTFVYVIGSMKKNPSQPVIG